MFKNLRDRLRGVSKKIEDELDVELEERLEAELQSEMAKDRAPETAGESEARTPEAPEQEPAKTESETESASEPEQDTPSERSESKPETGPEPVETASAPETSTKEAEPDKPAPAPERYGRKFLDEEEIERRLQRELEAAVDTQKEIETVVRSEARIARYTINEDVLDEILWELEIALLESDVALPVIEAIKENVKEQLLSMTVGGRDPGEIVEKVLRSSIKRVMSVNPIDFDGFVKGRLDEGKKPVVIMFVGVNGTGKTTSIGRIAHRLKQQGISSIMAAADTFRAGAIEQLALHGERLGVTVIKQKAGADPAAVCYDAVEHAKARNKDVVLLDTAGRMQTNRNLMDEMDKIRRVAKPDMTIFVGDSLAGNDAVEQARRFDEVVDIDGMILTKVDIDAKGGAALSVAYTINKPLLFVGVGQDYPDLRPFDAEWLVARLFGETVEA